MTSKMKSRVAARLQSLTSIIDDHVNQCQDSLKLLERSISDCAALQKKHTADVLREWNRKKELFSAALDGNQPCHITLGSLGLQFLEHGPIGKFAVVQQLLVYFASQTIFTCTSMLCCRSSASALSSTRLFLL